MLPILAALILQAMYGAVDLLIVGKFGTTAGISGVSTGSNIMNLYGMAFGSAVGVFIGAIAFLKGDLLACIFTSDPLVIARAFEYLRGFALEAVITCILFSYMGYFNGHAKSVFVMAQGLTQSFLIRLPLSYVMSIREHASLTGIAFAAPAATLFGIVLCTIYYKKLQKEL